MTRLAFFIFFATLFAIILLVSGRADADSVAGPDALKQSETQLREVIVAVIDTGGDTRHPDFHGHLWINPGEIGQDRDGREKATNGIDDDGNGFIDDVRGYNFVEKTGDITDVHGHGTHVGGIISRIAPNARLMFLKYYDPRISNTDAVRNTADAIRYAVKMGAKIINYSAGGSYPSAIERAAIAEARDQGVLFVAAAGNGGTNTDLKRYYPAGYGFGNILSIAAVDSAMTLLSSSNFGLDSVHLAAPGSSIRSTLPGGRQGLMTGTSQATAFASGAAALLVGCGESSENPERLISRLINSGVHLDSLRGKTTAQTALDLSRALAMKGRDQSTRNAGLIDPSLFSLRSTTDLLANPRIDRP